MSTINTNGIDVNYPIPGQNNSTQGFRDNFTAIKTNLNTAGSEITDLQNKVVLKSALANSVLNNDMANTLIANASTLQFRATTYNLGNALVDQVTVDCSLGDLQYGNLAGDIVLNFGSWAPTNTQSTVKLQLGRPNNLANYTITFSGNAQINQNSGWSLLENSGSNGGLATLTFPYDTTRLDLTVTSTDCGVSLNVEPTNRPYKTTQIQERTPSPVGFLGDTAGTVAVDANYIYVCTDSYDAQTSTNQANTTTAVTNIITFDPLSPLGSNIVPNMPVIFDTMFINGNSVTSFGNINAGQIYYVKTKPSSTTITISDTLYEGNAGSTLVLSTVLANTTTSMDATFYEGSSIWKSTKLLPIGDSTTIDNLLVSGNAVIQGNLIVNGTYTFENVTSLSVEDPIIEIGRGPNNTPLTNNDNKDRGEQLWYYAGSEKSAFIGFDNSQGKLIAAADVSVVSEIVTVNSYGNFRVGNLEAVNVNTTNLSTTGTFSASTISGNINADNLNVNGVANIPTVADIRIGGGLNGYYLVTDGTGNLSWVSGGGSGNGVVSGANTQIQFNDAGSFGAAAGFTFDVATNIFSTPGNIVSSGDISAINISLSNSITIASNLVAGNLDTTGILSVTGNANVGNLGTGGLIVATGNITGGNLNTTGVISVTGNANVGNLGTGGLIVATGNITGGNLDTTGILSVTGNANVGNLGTGGLIVATGNIIGGNLISTNYVIVSANNSITASGTTQLTATLLPSSINIITSGANNSGVILPIAEAGMRIIVRNSTSNQILVYPNTGAAIEPTLADFPYTLNASTSMEFFCSAGGSSGQWYTLF